MASIILGSVGAAAGAMVGGPFGAAVGRLLGSFAGRFIDNKIFSTTSMSKSSGPRLKDLSIQTSSYGITIPIIFGVVRIAGNIIWAQPLKEVTSTTQHTAGGKGTKVRHNHTEYSYFATFAISICEGEIDEVLRIFAGAKQLNITSYNIRIYNGNESQNPDPLIESIEGVDKTPAFRGQAYAVFENFPLSEFGNHLPNLNFEVRKKVFGKNEKTVESLVESVVIIPGGGEYVYDTVSQYKSVGNLVNKKWCDRGKPIALNHHTNTYKTNAVVAIDNLVKTLPNTEWVAVVVNWFGTSLNIADCKIVPGVEYNDNSSYNTPNVWNVAGKSRHDAHLISRNDGRPNYGGTINDESLVRFVQDLRSRGLKVVLYPIVFLDLPHKPWRGLINGNAKDVENFFEKDNGYNKFIIHYATLLKDKIDALIIGSEFRSLTSIQGVDNSFPVVDKFIKLAKKCRNIVGPNTVLTYAADWSEYHHTNGGWYHLDKLWACDDIDVIGIDAYFPLTNSVYTTYDVDEIKNGWTCGEGYDFYYQDDNKTIKRPLNEAYAWKNIAWWWENKHINPDGIATDWQPKSKKIWFTEYGFPSLDCSTNQPNVFFDSQSATPTYPKYSKGFIDFRAQSQAIVATELKWKNSNMIERKFLWCWDARPYPQWPDLSSVWSDGNAWQKGHWIQGKLSLSTLEGVLGELSYKAGLPCNSITTNLANTNIDGLVIDSQTSIRQVIEILQKAYQFDTIELDGQILFSIIQNPKFHNISYKKLAKLQDTPALTIKRIQDIDLPHKVDINYVDIAKNYQISNQHAHRSTTCSKEQLSIDLPLVMSAANAKLIAENCIHYMWNSRSYYSFHLPPKFIYLQPGDLVNIKYKCKTHHVKIGSIQIGRNNLLKIEANSYKKLNKTSIVNNFISENITEFSPAGETVLEILDIPYLNKFAVDESYVLIGARSNASSWTGASVYISTNKNSEYTQLCHINKLTTFGHIINKFKDVNPLLVDHKNKIIVNLEYGELFSVTPIDISNGANLCIIGNEILQFESAIQIDSYQYELSKLYRGTKGTEDYVNNHTSAERFILIDDNLQKINMPIVNTSHYLVKCVSDNQSLELSKPIEFNYQANCLKTFSPVWLKLTRINQKSSKLTWIRRNRQSSELNDFTDIALEIIVEKYLIHLCDVNKNIIESFTSTSAMLVIENSKLLNCSYIKICQLNNQSKEGYYGWLNLKL